MHIERKFQPFHLYLNIGIQLYFQTQQTPSKCQINHSRLETTQQAKPETFTYPIETQTNLTSSMYQPISNYKMQWDKHNKFKYTDRHPGNITCVFLDRELVVDLLKVIGFIYDYYYDDIYWINICKVNQKKLVIVPLGLLVLLLVLK